MSAFGTKRTSLTAPILHAIRPLAAVAAGVVVAVVAALASLVLSVERP